MKNPKIDEIICTPKVPNEAIVCFIDAVVSSEFLDNDGNAILGAIRNLLNPIEKKD